MEHSRTRLTCQTCLGLLPRSPTTIYGTNLHTKSGLRHQIHVYLFIFIPLHIHKETHLNKLSQIDTRFVRKWREVEENVELKVCIVEFLINYILSDICQIDQFV